MLLTLSNLNVDIRDVKNGNRQLIFSLWLDNFVHRELKVIQILCVRQKWSIKRDIELPVAIYDVRDVNVLVA